MNVFSFDIFLSYAHQDVVFARDLAGWLRECGLAVWLAEEQLVPGSRFRAGLEQGIRESRDLVAVLTEAYSSRPWTQREVDLFDLSADSSERSVLGIQIGETRPSQLDQAFQVAQRVRWNGRNFDPEGMWLLYCGIRRRGPGPRSQWAIKASSLRGDGERAKSKSVGSTNAENAAQRVDLTCLPWNDAEPLLQNSLTGTETKWRHAFAQLRLARIIHGISALPRILCLGADEAQEARFW
jgi:hypothetical protein